MNHIIMFSAVFILCSIIILPTQQISFQASRNLPNKPQEQKNANNDTLNAKNIPIIKIITNVTSTSTNITTNQIVNSNVPVPGLSKKDETILDEKSFDIEPGAISRGILVFVGIALLFVLYVGIKTYRRKKQNKSRVIVRKYGVRTTRSDVEMEPLPLSDEEEDETLFDLVASRNSTDIS